MPGIIIRVVRFESPTILVYFTLGYGIQIASSTNYTANEDPPRELLWVVEPPGNASALRPRSDRRGS
jgi:hypothetical protein